MLCFCPEKSQIIYFVSPDIDWKIKFHFLPQRIKSSGHVTHHIVADLTVDGKIIFCVCASGVAKAKLKKLILV